MKVIGITGPKNAGKDTVADFLYDLKRSNGKVSFAGPLKEICSMVFDLIPETFSDRMLKETPFTHPIVLTSRHLRSIKKEMVKMLDPVKYEFSVERGAINGIEHRSIRTPRELLQVIGTDFIRQRIDTNWHVKAAFADERLEQLGYNTFCVTDIRFLNEFQYLAEKFGDDFSGYYVDRPCAEEDLAQATHPSELGVLEVKNLIPETNIILNHGKLTDLKSTAKELKLDKAPTTKKLKGSKFKFVLKSEV
jgi:hypothetical protein